MANQPIEHITTLAYSINSFSKATSLGETLLRIAIKNGTLKAKRCGDRYVIPYAYGKEFIDNLPDHEG